MAIIKTESRSRSDEPLPHLENGEHGGLVERFLRILVILLQSPQAELQQPSDTVLGKPMRIKPPTKRRPFNQQSYLYTQSEFDRRNVHKNRFVTYIHILHGYGAVNVKFS